MGVTGKAEATGRGALEGKHSQAKGRRWALRTVCREHRVHAVACLLCTAGDVVLPG